MLEGKTEIMELYSESEPLQLEGGGLLPGVEVAFERYGRLNAAGDNAVLICHALTGDAHAAGTAPEKTPLYPGRKEGQPGWWDGLVGPGKAVDTERYHVLCANVLGSCYGTTGPASLNPRNGRPWGADFPAVTVRDMVRVQRRLLDRLGIHALRTVIGGSLGGMQALEWALMYPRRVRSVIAVATAARHSAWAIGFSHLMRQAIRNDPQWQQGRYGPQPARGLSLARQIGMISYRTDIAFQQRFGYRRRNGDDLFEVESYLNYQGQKLVERFDANSLLTLTEAMDRQDVGRGRGGVAAALAAISAPVLCMGIDSDLLYPAREQQAIARAIPGARYHEIRSVHGHDAFLIEHEQMRPVVERFIAEVGAGTLNKTQGVG